MLVVAKSGGTVVLYLLKEYFSPGDTVEFELDVKDGQVRIIAAKRLYNFDLNDIRKLTNQYDLTVEYDKELVDVLVFNAMRDGLSLSYTQSRSEAVAPGYVALSRSFQNLDLESYKRVNGFAGELKKRFDVIVETEGDLDTINIMKEPERYKLRQDEAVEAIRKSGRRGPFRGNQVQQQEEQARRSEWCSGPTEEDLKAEPKA